MDYQTGILSSTASPWNLSSSLGPSARRSTKLAGWTSEHSSFTAARLKAVYGSGRSIKSFHSPSEPWIGPTGNVNLGDPGHLHVPAGTLSVEDLRKMKAPLPLGSEPKPLRTTTVVDKATKHTRRHDFAYEVYS